MEIKVSSRHKWVEIKEQCKSVREIKSFVVNYFLLFKYNPNCKIWFMHELNLYRVDCKYNNFEFLFAVIVLSFPSPE